MVSDHETPAPSPCVHVESPIRVYFQEVLGRLHSTSIVSACYHQWRARIPAYLLEFGCLLVGNVRSPRRCAHLLPFPYSIPLRPPLPHEIHHQQLLFLRHPNDFFDSPRRLATSYVTVGIYHHELQT